MLFFVIVLFIHIVITAVILTLIQKLLLFYDNCFLHVVIDSCWKYVSSLEIFLVAEVEVVGVAVVVVGVIVVVVVD